MVERFPLSVLLVTLLAAGMFAGCVGEDDPKTPDDGTDIETPTAPTGSSAPPVAPGGKAVKDADTSGCRFEFCLEGHVYAPVWQEGMAWTYKVSGAPSLVLPADHEMTVGVMKVAEDHYKMGSNSETELMNSITFDGLLTVDVQKDSFAVFKKGEYRNILGFDKIGNAAWSIDGTPFYYNLNWDFTKSASQEITWAGGKGLGFRVEAIGSTGAALNIEYSSDAKWITLLEYLKTDGTPYVRYELQAFHPSHGTADLKSWEKGWERNIAPIGNVPANVAPSWTSSGQGKIVMRLVTQAGVTSSARIISTGGANFELSHSSGAAVQDTYQIHPDAAAQYAMIITGVRDSPTAVNTARVYAIQIFEHTAGG